MASRTTDPAFARLSLARAQSKSLLTMTYGAVSHRDLSQCWRCSCPPLLPATRGILAAHVYTTPHVRLRRGCAPLAAATARDRYLRRYLRRVSLSGPPPTWRDASGTIELLVHGRAVLPGARLLMVVGGDPSTFLRCAARPRSPPRCRQWLWALLAAVRHQELMRTLRAGMNNVRAREGHIRYRSTST
jgi:hypothetical protein